MLKHEYYAIFNPAEEGGFCVTFPDLQGAITEGDSFGEALFMARDCLTTYLSGEPLDTVPQPSTKEEIERVAASDPDIAEGWRVVLIKADLKRLFPDLYFTE